MLARALLGAPLRVCKFCDQGTSVKHYRCTLYLPRYRSAARCAAAWPAAVPTETIDGHDAPNCETANAQPSMQCRGLVPAHVHLWLIT